MRLRYLTNHRFRLPPVGEANGLVLESLYPDAIEDDGPPALPLECGGDGPTQPARAA